MTLRAVDLAVAILLASVTVALHGCGTDTSALRGVQLEEEEELPTPTPTVTPAQSTSSPTAAPTQDVANGDALSLDAWSQAISAEGAAATLNTHNGGYDLPSVDVCFHDQYSDIVSRDAANWISIDEWKAFGLSRSVTTTIPASVSTTGTSVSARDVNVAQLTVTEGGVEKTIDAAVGFGHGVGSLKCGDCYIIKTSGTNLPEGSWIHSDANFDELIAYDKQTRYSVIRTVDIATWSLEISDPALYYLLPLDGRIDHTTQPVYQRVDCKEVMNSAGVQLEEEEELPTPTPTVTPAQSASSPTAAPAQDPSEAATSAPSAAPTQAPEPLPELCTVGCFSCAAVEDNVRDEAISDDECAVCIGTSQSWWPCYLDGAWSSDLCKCADGEPASPPATPTPTTAGLFTPLPTLSPTLSDGVCTAVGPSCDFTPGEGISSWFTRELFDEMFPNICSSSCRGCELLQYECLIKATLLYPDFAASSSVDDNKRELAAWLGEMSQETNGGGCLLSQEGEDGTCSCGPMWCDGSPGGGCSAWGLCFVEEAAGATYCSPSSEYPCTAGKEYTGRGPKQLSWNYNYGQFSEEFCGDKSILLDNPEWVASNPTLTWASSMWFWFTGGACLPGESCKPSCHDVFLGKKDMCAGDTSAGRQYGLGWVTNIINGGLECGGAGAGKCDYRVQSRVRFYQHFCDILDVNPLADGWTEEDNLFCHDQDNYVQSPPQTC